MWVTWKIEILNTSLYNLEYLITKNTVELSNRAKINFLPWKSWNLSLVMKHSVSFTRRLYCTRTKNGVYHKLIFQTRTTSIILNEKFYWKISSPQFNSDANFNVTKFSRSRLFVHRILLAVKLWNRCQSPRARGCPVGNWNFTLERVLYVPQLARGLLFLEFCAEHVTSLWRFFCAPVLEKFVSVDVQSIFSSFVSFCALRAGV